MGHADPSCEAGHRPAATGAESAAGGAGGATVGALGHDLFPSIGRRWRAGIDIAAGPIGRTATHLVNALKGAGRLREQGQREELIFCLMLTLIFTSQFLHTVRKHKKQGLWF